jgi:hypothetical protein
MPLLLPLGPGLRGLFIGLPHHVLFFGLPCVGAPIWHRPAVIQIILRNTSRLIFKMRKQLIESLCLSDPCVVFIRIKPFRIYIIKPLVISKLNIVCALNVSALYFCVIFQLIHRLSLVSFVEGNPRVKVCGVFRPLLFLGIPRVHLEPYFLSVLPIKEVFRLGVSMPALQNTSICPKSK